MSNIESVQQYDDFLSDHLLDRVLKYIQRDRWGIQSSLPNSSIKFLAMNLDDISLQEDIFNEIKKLIGDNYKIDRAHFNGQFYGMSGEPHADGNAKNKYTFLIYTNKEWDFLWGGQTIFFDRYMIGESEEIIINSSNFKSYYPKPKSALFFPSNLMHYAERPTKQCYEMRLTLAYKLERIY